MQKQLDRQRHAVLVLFLSGVLVFGMLAYRSERTDQAMRDYTYKSCVARKINIDRLNAFNRGMIAIEQRNPYRATSPTTIRHRIALYQAAMLTPVPPCKVVKKW